MLLCGTTKCESGLSRDRLNPEAMCTFWILTTWRMLKMPLKPLDHSTGECMPVFALDILAHCLSVQTPSFQQAAYAKLPSTLKT